ncbi:hypothetical protein AAU57_04420 [Nonlabens sp. YIK11]|nr:hypothetical protein AAU57_04420 [Nonlabens sp. YIK11]
MYSNKLKSSNYTLKIANRLIYALFVITILTGCENKQKDFEQLESQVEKEYKKIKKLSYDVQNIMHFADGTIWDNQGSAIIERDENDEIFGFSFYGIRNDLNRALVYDNGEAFQLYNQDKKIRIETPDSHLLGTPGGQMIYEDIFKLEEEYQSVDLVETDSTYHVRYKFADDTIYNSTERTKELILRHHDLLPIYVKTEVQPEVGNKFQSIYKFSNYKLNDSVQSSIENKKRILNEYEPIVYDEPAPNPIIGKKIPEITLPKLFEPETQYALNQKKLTLIDFWEIWCGPCIQSFPKIQNLNDTYSDNLQIIGVVTEDYDFAQDLVKKRNANFLNLRGNKDLKKEFRVFGVPNYFLVDEKGIVLHQYVGYTEKIESDIKEYLSKQIKSKPKVMM